LIMTALVTFVSIGLHAEFWESEVISATEPTFTAGLQLRFLVRAASDPAMAPRENVPDS
jgi:hypothetical protein